MIRIAAALLAFCLALTSGTASAQNGLEIYIFRVGQADSMLIVGPAPARRTLLVDLGVSRHRPYTGSSTARHVARRIFEITGRRRVDYFLLTHFHSDHFGGDRSGVTHLLDNEGFTIGTAIDTGSLGREYVSRSDDAQEYIERFVNWRRTGRIQHRTEPIFGLNQIDLGAGVRVEIVAYGGRYAPNIPSVHQQYERTNPGHYARNPASENDLSIAFELSLGDFEFWSGGDLSGAAGDGTSALSGSGNAYTNVEAPMVAHWIREGRETDVEIYRANHHGSTYSTTPQLLAALDPEHVLYSAQEGHNHPSRPIVDRVQHTARQHATDLDRSAWGTGDAFRSRRGAVQGEIQVFVAPGGGSYTINGTRFRSYSDAEERAGGDARAHE